MKKILILTLLSIGLISCSNDDLRADGSDIDAVSTSASALKSANPNSVSSYADYNVAVATTSGGSVWTYTITKSKNNSKNLSHFIINLQNCGDESATFGDIISATTNGEPADLKPTEGQGTDCNPQAITENFVKINTSGSGPWVIVITFDRAYSSVSSTSWIKAGTSCNTGAVASPGCPIEEYCALSQGYFFANGGLHNGSDDVWSKVGGLTIGGYTYTHAEGMYIWSVNRGFGGNQVLNGFFQLGAARLSGIESAVQEQANIIEAYFAGLEKSVLEYETLPDSKGRTYYNLPASSGGVTSAEVTKAGGAIGAYIDANHCE
ncbi:hypothetical protein SAMN03097699_1103 [Flavobacteriaceae bacterium MAR_2010_188]|nr:hypothetical protein SAMN03097699_1103 [Flavobacteriaceae bacterium MAR_2010_188]